MRLPLLLALWLAVSAFTLFIGGNATVAPPPAPPASCVFTSCTISLIHNAPGWLASHSYAQGARVNNGAGWNTGSATWNPGQLLRAYQVTSGTCTSAASGGPSGTGIAIADGTCTWQYVSDTDYISITGWAFDATAWTAKTYTYRDFVVSDSPLSSYALETGATGPGGTCASTVTPVGTGTPTPGTPTSSGQTSINTNNIVTMGDGCQWRWMGFVTYTSKKSFIPQQKWVYNGVNHMVPGTYNLVTNYQANLYNDREYVAGSNGENAPISLCGHTDLTGCSGTGELTNSESCVAQSTGNPNGCFQMVLTTAPGESFRDKLTAGSALAGYNQANGVALFNNTVYPNLFGGANQATGLLEKDQYVYVQNLQIKSTNSIGLDAYNYHANFAACDNCIIEGGSPASGFANPAVALDAGPSYLANSLVVSHGPIGVFAKYDAKWLHNTIVTPDAPATSLCIAQYWTGFGSPNGTTVFGNSCFGFTHATAGLDGSQGGNGTAAFLSDSDRNTTDVGSGDTGTVSPGFPGGGSLFDVVALPGAHTLYSVTAANALVAPYTDMREKTAAVTRSAGGNYGAFVQFCRIAGCAAPPLVSLTLDTPDIIGTTRPGASGYDIGAWQAP